MTYSPFRRTHTQDDGSKIERIQELWDEMVDHVENLDYAFTFCQVSDLRLSPCLGDG